MRVCRVYVSAAWTVAGGIMFSSARRRLWFCCLVIHRPTVTDTQREISTKTLPFCKYTSFIFLLSVWFDFCSTYSYHQEVVSQLLVRQLVLLSKSQIARFGMQHPVSAINFLILFASLSTLSLLLIPLISVHLLCHNIHCLSLIHSFAAVL